MKDRFCELKRRNVYKVAVAYPVVRWLMIQAASIFLPTFEAPPWAQKAFEQLRQLYEQHHTAAYSLILVPLGLGHKTGALHWLEETYHERDGDSIGVICVDPLLIALHGDLGFEALAEKIMPAIQFGERTKE